MSRRYSSRTVIEAGTPQAWVAHWWDDAWAEETMAVCERVYWVQRRTLLKGAYTTGRFTAVDEHYRGWLIEKALEFRAGWNPFTARGDLETAWYRTLHANLTNVSKWHFWHYCREHGVAEHIDPTVVWTTSSADALTEEFGEAWVGDRYRQNQDLLLQDPEKVIILLETILTGPSATDMLEALKDPMLCEEYGCRQLKNGPIYCSSHWRREKELWGDPDRPRCAADGCTKYATTRGRCTAHYSAFRDQAVADGTWEPRKLKSEMVCAADGCQNIVGANGRNGLCLAHYRAEQDAEADPCITTGCDRKARHNDGRCNICRAAWRKAQAGPCIAPNCDKPGSYSKGRCYAHAMEERKAQSDPCITEGCDKPGWKARGMCGPCHSKSLRARQKEQQ